MKKETFIQEFYENNKVIKMNNAGNTIFLTLVKRLISIIIK